MKLSYSMQGAIFGPLLIALAIILKLFCPDTAGAICFADYLAVPIFIPLNFIAKVFQTDLAFSYELLFIAVYWSLVFFLLGFILDLYIRRSQY